MLQIDSELAQMPAVTGQPLQLLYSSDTSNQKVLQDGSNLLNCFRCADSTLVTPTVLSLCIDGEQRLSKMTKLACGSSLKI